MASRHLKRKSLLSIFSVEIRQVDVIKSYDKSNINREKYCYQSKHSVNVSRSCWQYGKEGHKRQHRKNNAIIFCRDWALLNVNVVDHN